MTFSQDAVASERVREKTWKYTLEECNLYTYCRENGVNWVENR